MRESAAVVAAWLRFCDGVSNKRLDEFDDIVSAEARLIIGTAPGENVSDRAAMRFGFETEGVTLHSRDAHGYQEGSLGWVVDQPRFVFPDGSGMDWRVTAILRDEDATWRLVHAQLLSWRAGRRGR
jgi:hypothetical protein